MPRRRSVALVATLLLLAAVTPALALPDPKEEWTQLRTPGFTVFSNAPAQRTIEVARNLETLRAVLAQVTKGMRIDVPKPLHVYVFRSTPGFRSYIGDVGKGSKELAGFHLTGPDRNMIAIDLSAESMGVAYHEYLHEVLANTFPGIPLWVNEGLAEFYAPFVCKDAKAEIGRAMWHHMLGLREAPLLPLSDLVDVTTDSPAYNENDRAGVFYAESWALVHYLTLGRAERRAQLPRYLQLVSEGQPAAEAFRAAFETDYGTLEAELHAYLHAEELPYTVVTLRELQTPAIEQPHPMERKQTLVHLGWLRALAEDDDFTEAERHHRAALELDPAYGPAHAGLGFIRMRQGRTDEAVAVFEQALASGPNDPGMNLLAGLSLLVKSSPEEGRFFTTPAELPPEVARARVYLAKVLEADPENPSALFAYGETFVFDPGTDIPSAAVLALEKAASQMPSDANLAFSLVYVYIRAGFERKAAATIEHHLARVASPELVAIARDGLLVFDEERAGKLFDQGQLDEGLAVVKAMHERAQTVEARAFVEAELKRAEAFVSKGLEIRRYDEGVAQLRAGKLDEARKTFAAIVADCRDPQVCAEAKKALDELAAALGQRKMVR